MPGQRRHQKSYDHRLRDLVRETGDLTVATERGVPRSTAVGWLRAEKRDIVTLDVLDQTESQLRAEVLKLRRRVRIFGAVIRLRLQTQARALARAPGLVRSTRSLVGVPTGVRAAVNTRAKRPRAGNIRESRCSTQFDRHRSGLRALQHAEGWFLYLLAARISDPSDEQDSAGISIANEERLPFVR